MITAVDSSVLLCIFNSEDGAERWLEALIQARREGRLVICEIVYAELAVGFEIQKQLDHQLAALGIVSQPLESAAGWRAGKVFESYRQAGGTREHLIPDFLIAAHAQVQADRLAAVDRGYLRRWFGNLSLLT